LNKDLIIVKAKIHLKTTQEGGRKTPIKSVYRPNHVFVQPEDIKDIHTYIGVIHFDGQEAIQPGETKIVTVRFLRDPTVEKYIKVGQRWFIYEIPRLVAEGEIIEV
jgi:translation elongation factor EF-Tu-like GTPase